MYILVSSELENALCLILINYLEMTIKVVAWSMVMGSRSVLRIVIIVI